MTTEMIFHIHGKKPQEDRKQSIFYKDTLYRLRKALNRDWRGKESVSDRSPQLGIKREI